MKYYAYFEYGPRGLGASRWQGYGQLFLFPLSSAKHFSATSIPTHTVWDAMSDLYELQDAVKESRGRTSWQQAN